MTIEQTKTLHGKYQTTHIHQIRQTGQNAAIIALFVHYNFDFKIIRRTNTCNDDINI